eukprot:3567833-Amphidinium_carterae.1
MLLVFNLPHALAFQAHRCLQPPLDTQWVHSPSATMTTEMLLHGIVELFPADTFPVEVIDNTAVSLRNVTLDAFF